MNTEELERNPHEDRLQLTVMILDEFNPTDFLPRRGLKTRPGIKEYEPAVITEQVRAMTISGLLEIRGGRFRAAYRLTPLGVIAQQELRTMLPQTPEPL